MNFLYCFFFFFLIILISYQGTLSPIFDRILTTVVSNNALTSTISLWGYFGAFVLGRESIILDKSIINNLLDIKIHLNNFALLKTLVKLNIENGFGFFYLNIIPSLAGLYHFGVLQKTNYFFTASLLFSILSIFI